LARVIATFRAAGARVGRINRGGSYDYFSQSCTGVLAASRRGEDNRGIVARRKASVGLAVALPDGDRGALPRH
jgi:hypothetical protein